VTTVCFWAQGEGKIQTIYGAGLASNINLTAQKRTIRPVYSNTLAHPYAATLDPSFRNTDGSIRLPKAADRQNVTSLGAAAASPLTRSADVFTYNGSIVPGTVMVKTNAGEYVAVGGDITSYNNQPFGLLGQWIGGTFDNLGQNNQVGVWQGFDSVYELLAPAWDDTNVPSAINSSVANGAIGQVLLYAGADGRLTATPVNAGYSVPVARVIDRPASSRLLIQLIV
jgi:hypothetical protein